MNRRADQLASTVRAALTEVIARGLSDPRLEGVLLTVTTLNISQDLRSATIGVSVLPEKHSSRAIAAVRHAAPHLRRKVGDSTGLSAVPELNFVLDESAKRQAGVLEALSRARQAGAYPDTGGTPGGGEQPPPEAPGR